MESGEHLMALYQRRTKTITAAYTVTDADVGYIIICKATAAITVTMQSATGRDNFWLTLQNIAADDVTCEGVAIVEDSFAEISNDSGTWVVTSAGSGAGGGQTAVFTNIAVSANGTILADTAADTLHFQGINYIECSTDTATKTVIIDLSHIGATGAFSSIVVSGQNTIYAQTSSDALEFVASSNMTITTDTAAQTVTFASSGGGQSAVFTSIEVSGQSTILADTAADTLEFIAGTAMTITTNTANKTVTFNAVATGYVTVAFKYIEVSGQGTVTADTAADTVELIASSNITLTTNTANKTITIAATGGGQSASFTSILVSGQSTILATTAADSLEFVASSNITITTNTSNKTVTIAAASGGTLPIASSDNYIYVGYKLSATGTVTITAGDTTVTGNGTAFTAEFSAGDFIQLDPTGNGEWRQISAIASATQLTLDEAVENDYAAVNISKSYEGNDANSGTAQDSTNALATITHALTHIEADKNNSIVIMPRSYTAEDTITIDDSINMAGTGITLQAEDHANRANVRIDSIFCYNTHKIKLLQLRIVDNFDGYTGIYLAYVQEFECGYLYMDNADGNSTYGINCQASNGNIYYSTISHRSTALECSQNAKVTVAGCSGTDNTLGLSASYGGFISRIPIDQFGSTTAESITDGGYIGPFPYYKTITANYSCTYNNSNIYSNETATITLPPPSVEYQIKVKRINAVGTATITNNAGETIDGAASVTLSSQNESKTFVSDGVNWFVT